MIPKRAHVEALRNVLRAAAWTANRWWLTGQWVKARRERLVVRIEHSQTHFVALGPDGSDAAIRHQRGRVGKASTLDVSEAFESLPRDVEDLGKRDARSGERVVAAAEDQHVAVGEPG